MKRASGKGTGGGHAIPHKNLKSKGADLVRGMGPTALLVPQLASPPYHIGVPGRDFEYHAVLLQSPCQVSYFFEFLTRKLNILLQK